MSGNRQHGSATENVPARFETNGNFGIGSPKFETPVEIGSFSLDIKTEFENSKKSMRYFIKPPNPKRVNFDLRKGYDTMIKNEKGRESHILNILHWIVENLEKFPTKGRKCTKGPNKGASGRDIPKKDKGNSASSFSQHSDDQSQIDRELADVQTGLSDMKISKEGDSEASAPSDMSADGEPRTLNTNFVCRRGLLAKVMCTPYEEREDWIIAVVLHNGTYYLNEIETEQKKQDKAKMAEQKKQNEARMTEQKKQDEARITDDEMCCWGSKFEQYLKSDSKDGVPDPDAQYNNCEAFYTVVRTQLNNHSLVFSGEVDALNTDKEKGSYYVQFKTNREFVHQGHVKTFKRFKVRNWWTQNYIIGVQEIVCGFRDDKGIVHRLEFYKTKDLPNLAKDLYNPWKPNVCFNFLDQFLSFIKSAITTDDHKKVHILKWSPGGPVRCSQPLVDSEYNFLPDWYTDALK
ncbi:decapping and exoribonuclease protein-like [Mercenaria mercenaria]|uniref:decapping and exoribonuclease protein-like n=1 Tax=Mercenaria mercenaria TaxID=6596 RepID=UPI00234EE967|nr:decapping and exoribonuclease protein-like [Mercenaria mercenaria]